MRQSFREKKGASFANVWASIFSVELSGAKDLNKEDTVVECRMLKRIVVSQGHEESEGCGQFAMLRCRC